MSKKYVDLIAEMLTEDPDILNEKKAKRPKVDHVEVEKKFKAEDALEDKDAPAKPSKKDRNQKSKLNKLEGAKQTGKPEIKPKNVKPKVFKNSKKRHRKTIKESEKQPCWVCGKLTDKHPGIKNPQGKDHGYCGCEEEPKSEQRKRRRAIKEAHPHLPRVTPRSKMQAPSSAKTAAGRDKAPYRKEQASQNRRVLQNIMRKKKAGEPLSKVEQETLAKYAPGYEF